MNIGQRNQEYSCLQMLKLPKSVFSIVRQIRKSCLIYIKHPYVLAISTQLEAFSISNCLIYHHSRVLPVLVAEHVMPHIAFTCLWNSLPVYNVVGFHCKSPARAGKTRSRVDTGGKSWPEEVDFMGYSQGKLNSKGKKKEQQGHSSHVVVLWWSWRNHPIYMNLYRLQQVKMEMVFTSAIYCSNDEHYRKVGYFTMVVDLNHLLSHGM